MHSVFISEGLEHFCQPDGWSLRAERESPKFFVAVLTDINGCRHYCAVLSFSEAVAKEILQDAKGRHTADEEMEEEADSTGGGLVSLVGGGVIGTGPPGGGRGGGGVGGAASLKSTSLPRHAVPGVSLPGVASDAVMFAPKCLVLVSRHDLPDVLRSCLRVLYTAYSECLVGAGGERVRLETLVGNLLGSVFVPPHGSPQLRFSLGASDRLALQPPVHPAVPRTGDSVALLFRQLGVKNVLTLFCACTTELKLLFYSSSFMRLSGASRALVSLMYPMRYSHVFIPVLPSSLLQVLDSPTPFVIGVSSAHEAEIVDLLDVVKVDLDGGCITIPENMTVPSLPPLLHHRVAKELSLVLQPELAVADDAFPELNPPTSSGGRGHQHSMAVLDKELRAVMLRLMIRLLAGYRECLTLVRIHPEPFITFHKAAFLGLREDLVKEKIDSHPFCNCFISHFYPPFKACDSGFARRLLDCMFFGTFVCERGLPWRRCDVFDDSYASSGEHFALEVQDETTSDPRGGFKVGERALRHIRLLAEELYRNENPVRSPNQPYSQKIPQPAEGAMSRIHQPVFPMLEDEMVDEIIQGGLERFRIE